MTALLIIYALWSFLRPAIAAPLSSYSDAAQADLVVGLPGAPPAETDSAGVITRQFSGYLTVGETKHLHYWYVESANDPASDPVAFWTNGGPGCSGLIGFLAEQGPYRVNADLTLSTNQFAWNRRANMVFIEAPVGVGFSYSDTPSVDYSMGDAQTAADNYNLIQAFLDRFPSLRSNDLYISSESYGGHYMPTLAMKILDENAAGIRARLNFKGVAVGNPYTDPFTGLVTMLDTMWGHQLLSKPTWTAYLANCTERQVIDLEVAEAHNRTIADPAGCEDIIMALLDEAGALDPYAVDYKICTAAPSVLGKGRAQRLWFLNSLLAAETKEAQTRSNLRASVVSTLRRRLDINEYVPCEMNYAVAYLNRADVKAALHVNDGTKWSECSTQIHYNISDFTQAGTSHLYKQIVNRAPALKVLVYSGDDDSVCGTVGTQRWIFDLGFELQAEDLWREYLVDGQLAGYRTTWAGTNLAFLTVHGAGHEVPAFKPAVAADLWFRFLAGNWAL